MHRCFDYSRCSLFSSFLIYIYPNRNNDSIYQQFSQNEHIMKDPNIACIYMLLIGKNFQYLNDSEKFQNFLYKLPYWGGNKSLFEI